MVAWKPVVRDPSYEVSDDGRVRSTDRTVLDYQGKPRRLSGRKLRVRKHVQGYHSVSLSGQKQATVHSLVAEAFIGPRPHGMDINHINGDKRDNRVENLEYCSRAANMRHAVAAGLMPPPPLKRGTDQHKSRLDEAQVRRVRAYRKLGWQIADIARFFSVGKSTVANILNGNSWAWLPDDSP